MYIYIFRIDSSVMPCSKPNGNRWVRRMIWMVAVFRMFSDDPWNDAQEAHGYHGLPAHFSRFGLQRLHEFWRQSSAHCFVAMAGGTAAPKAMAISKSDRTLTDQPLAVPARFAHFSISPLDLQLLFHWSVDVEAWRSQSPSFDVGQKQQQLLQKGEHGSFMQIQIFASSGVFQPGTAAKFGP